MAPTHLPHTTVYVFFKGNRCLPLAAEEWLHDTNMHPKTVEAKVIMQSWIDTHLSHHALESATHTTHTRTHARARTHAHTHTHTHTHTQTKTYSDIPIGGVYQRSTNKPRPGDFYAFTKAYQGDRAANSGVDVALSVIHYSRGQYFTFCRMRGEGEREGGREEGREGGREGGEFRPG